MQEITSTIEYKGKKYALTWITDSNLDIYVPASQIYGIVFNKNGEILIARAKEDGLWQIPGGKPEKDESYVDALSRELKEEVDVTVTQITPLGAQKVELEENDKRKLSSYQLRYIALLDKLLPQSLDPDLTINTVWERKFIPFSEVKNYVRWGEVGDAMFDDAVRLFNRISGG